jgi:hypothetical protein
MLKIMVTHLLSRRRPERLQKFMHPALQLLLSQHLSKNPHPPLIIAPR